MSGVKLIVSATMIRSRAPMAIDAAPSAHRAPNTEDAITARAASPIPISADKSSSSVAYRPGSFER